MAHVTNPDRYDRFRRSGLNNIPTCAPDLRLNVFWMYSFLHVVQTKFSHLVYQGI